MQFARVPAGDFRMGSDLRDVDECVAYWAPRLLDDAYTEATLRAWIMKEHPAHMVCLAAYGIGRYPVTNAEYSDYVDDTGTTAPPSLVLGVPGDHPVWGVSFEEATRFAAWWSARQGIVARLPSEAEWERAARGPSGLAYPFGRVFDANACNTSEAGIGRTTPVDAHAHAASEFGVCDLAGNVEEWTADWYAPYPGGIPIEDDLWRASSERYRILRGGSFARGGDLARSARRHGPFPAPDYRYTGFRLVIAGGDIDADRLNEFPRCRAQPESTS